jgi:hypothetical protein
MTTKYYRCESDQHHQVDVYACDEYAAASRYAKDAIEQGDLMHYFDRARDTIDIEVTVLGAVDGLSIDDEVQPVRPELSFPLTTSVTVGIQPVVRRDIEFERGDDE